MALTYSVIAYIVTKTFSATIDTNAHIRFLLLRFPALLPLFKKNALMYFQPRGGSTTTFNKILTYYHNTKFVQQMCLDTAALMRKSRRLTTKLAFIWSHPSGFYQTINKIMLMLHRVHQCLSAVGFARYCLLTICSPKLSLEMWMLFVKTKLWDLNL